MASCRSFSAFIYKIPHLTFNTLCSGFYIIDSSVLFSHSHKKINEKRILPFDGILLKTFLSYCF